MTPPTHRISPRIFSALAEGGGGSEAVSCLAAIRRSKNLLLVRTLVDLTTKIGHHDAPVVENAYRTLSEIEKLAPAAVATVLNYPSVSAWILRTVILLNEDRPADAQPAQLAAVAASAAVHGAVTTTVDLPVTNSGHDTVELPSLGLATFPSRTSGVVSLTIAQDRAVLSDKNAAVEIPHDPGQHALNWCGTPRITIDYDGYRIRLLLDGWSSQYLPEIVTVRDDLFDQQVIETWRTAMTAGWRVLVENHREVAAEAAAAYTMLVPLRGSGGHQVSVTLSDAFGCVAMSLPLDSRFTALTLAHEVQHAKLSVLTDLFPLVDQTEERFYAPWRDDPRPLNGLLQGTYAHFGIAGFWQRQRHREKDPDHARYAEVEFARWCAASREVAHFLAGSRKLTPIGQKFVTGMIRVLDEWNTNHVSRSARVAAQRLAEQHRRRWQAAHGQAGSRP